MPGAQPIVSRSTARSRRKRPIWARAPRSMDIQPGGRRSAEEERFLLSVPSQSTWSAEKHAPQRGMFFGYEIRDRVNLWSFQTSVAATFGKTTLKATLKATRRPPRPKLRQRSDMAWFSSMDPRQMLSPQRTRDSPVYAL